MVRPKTEVTRIAGFNICQNSHCLTVVFLRPSLTDKAQWEFDIFKLLLYKLSFEKVSSENELPT